MSEKGVGGAFLSTWLRKFEALSLRERVMVTLTVLAATFFLAHALLFGAWSRQNDGLKASLVEKRQEINRVSAQIDELKARAAIHPDAEARVRIEEIERKIAAIDAGLQSAAERLVPPEQMAVLLEDLLKRNRRLQLVKMKTLPAQALIGRDPSVAHQAGAESIAAQAGQGSSPGIFKHGVELTLRGSYFDMLEYLAQIESLPWQMYWARLELDAREYSRPELTLTLYTLSLDKAWLTI